MLRQVLFDIFSLSRFMNYGDSHQRHRQLVKLRYYLKLPLTLTKRKIGKYFELVTFGRDDEN